MQSAEAACVPTAGNGGGGLRRSFVVSTLRSLNRRQSYVVVLDFAAGELHWHKLRRGVEVKRTFSFQSCIKLEKNLKDPLCLSVQFAEAGDAVPVGHAASEVGGAQGPSGNVSPHSTTTTSSSSSSSSSSVWQKLAFFSSTAERGLFCNLVHSAIVSGFEAVRVYQRLQQTSGGGGAESAPLSPSSSPSLSPALLSLVGVDFCSFLIAFCSAQTALDLKVIAAANTASTHSTPSTHSSHPSQSSALTDQSVSSLQQVVAAATASPSSSQPPTASSEGPTLKEMYGFELLEGEVIVLQSKHTTRRDAGAATSEGRGGWGAWDGRRLQPAAAHHSRPSSAGHSPRPPSPSSGPSLSSTAPLSSSSSSRGNLFVTNYRLIYVPYRTSSSPPHPFFPASASDCEVTLGSLSRIIRPSPSLSSLVLLTKDYRRLEFAFDASVDWVEGLHQQLATMAFHHHKGSAAFVWEHGRAMKRKREEQRRSADSADGGGPSPAEVDGWALYSPVEEYTRLGLLHSPHFRLSDVNSAFSLCASYPPSFIVPKAMGDADLATIASYRSQGRLPATVYLHPITGASLSRAAQPLSGVRGRRSEMDEALVALLRKSNPLHSTSTFHIIDARPYKAAMGNAVMGKGYENVHHYQHTQLSFMNIDNIHAVRHSLDKLAAACAMGGAAGEELSATDGATASSTGGAPDDAATSVDDLQWLGRLDASQWLHYLRLVLSAAVRVALLLSVQGSSVLVRCSDGWDRTSQLASLVLLMLDPYHRTLEGFAVLIEKEWLSFGHHFARRHGHGSEQWDDEQRAPIFLQWLDCVWQVWRQSPHKFEFNEDALIDVYDAVIGGRFGTFMFDSQREREEQKVKQATESLWTFMLHSTQRQRYSNPLYRPPHTHAIPTSSHSHHSDLIDALVSASTSLPSLPSVDYCIPNTSAKRLVLWERLHLRWDRSFVRGLSVESMGLWGQEHVGERKERRRLERKYHTMRSRLEQAGVDVAAFDDADSDEEDGLSLSFQPQPLPFVEGGGGRAERRPVTTGSALSQSTWSRKERKSNFATLSPQQVRQLNGRGGGGESFSERGGAANGAVKDGGHHQGKVRVPLQLNTFSPPTPTAAAAAASHSASSSTSSSSSSTSSLPTDASPSPEQTLAL